MEIKRQQLLAEISEMYYKEGLSQEQVAIKTGYSRSNISRLLKEGIETGVVTILIKHPLKLAKEIQAFFLKEFDLKVALIVDVQGVRDNEIPNNVAQVAADYVQKLLEPGDIIGLSWGNMLSLVVNYLTPFPIPLTKVVQIGGSSDSLNPGTDGSEILRRFSKKIGASSRILPAPLLADDKNSSKVLLNQSSVNEVLQEAAKSRIILVGIGSVTAKLENQTVSRFTLNDLMGLSKEGAVGDICGFHYNIEGNLVDTDINQRVIALNPERWGCIPYMIGVTSGVSKASAVLGALRGRRINGLIIDSQLANEVLRLHKIKTPE